MSYPSGQQLMQQLIDDKTLPLSTRLQAVREATFRPTLTFLLRLINDPDSHAKLRAAAVIRYNQVRLSNWKQYAWKQRSRSRSARTTKSGDAHAGKPGVKHCSNYGAWQVKEVRCQWAR